MLRCKGLKECPTAVLHLHFLGIKGPKASAIGLIRDSTAAKKTELSAP